jgi:hypothetical protein
MARCYDPGRMAIAPDAGRLIRTAAWVALAAILALGSAGLIAQLSHPPGGPSRAELTYTADLALAVRLDDATTKLQDIAELVDHLSADAKTALEAVNGHDPSTLQATLDRGGSTARLIQSSTHELLDSLAGLPGEGPVAAATYANATLVRRSAILAALDAASGLADQWAHVTGRSVDASRLTLVLQDHDATVAAAAQQGVAAKYSAALVTLAHALDLLDEIDSLRTSFSSTSEVSVLDEWLLRHRVYDHTLVGLYRALKASGGKRNAEVDDWFRQQEAALANLPQDDSALIVIVSQIAEGGLNQAVVAIEDASGRIDRALAEASPA